MLKFVCEAGGRSDTPEGEDTLPLHDVKFARLVKMEDVAEETRIPIKIKLLLLNVIVVTHLQEVQGGQSEGKAAGLSKN